MSTAKLIPREPEAIVLPRRVFSHPLDERALQTQMLSTTWTPLAEGELVLLIGFIAGRDRFGCGDEPVILVDGRLCFVPYLSVTRLRRAGQR